MSQTPESTVALIKKFVIEVQQNARYEIIPQLVSPDFKDHTAQPGADATIAGVEQIMRYIHSVFGDIKVEIVHCVSDGDVVATNKIIRGVQTGNFAGKPATNKLAEIRIMDFIQIIDGKIKNHWACTGPVVDL